MMVSRKTRAFVSRSGSGLEEGEDLKDMSDQGRAATDRSMIRTRALVNGPMDCEVKGSG
jgi:hypothetical protein